MIFPFGTFQEKHFSLLHNMNGYLDNELQHSTFQDCKNMGLCLVDLIQAVVDMGEYKKHREELNRMAVHSRDDEAMELLEEYDEYFKRRMAV